MHSVFRHVGFMKFFSLFIGKSSVPRGCLNDTLEHLIQVARKQRRNRVVDFWTTSIKVYHVTGHAKKKS
jgi:hypothetical protein